MAQLLSKVFGKKSKAEPLGPGDAWMINAVYYPNWRVYRQKPPSSLNVNFITHIFYAFAWPKADGTIASSDKHADYDVAVDGTLGCLRALSKLKQNHPHLTIILSFGGGGKGSDKFAALASHGESRRRFAREAARLADTYKFDGIDIDWEVPSSEQQGLDYVELLSTLRRAFPRPALLTSALPASPYQLRHINLKDAAEQLDMVMLMAYDFSGPWSPVSRHHAQLHSSRQDGPGDLSCTRGVDYLSEHGVPLSKVVLGVPVYGRSFEGCNGPGQSYSSCGGEEGTYEYHDLPLHEGTEQTDKKLGAAYCVSQYGGFVTYDNVKTVAMKAAWVKNNGLAGLFYWHGTGDKEGNQSVVRSGWRELHA